MKLVILIYSLSGGGAERVVSYLLQSLKNRKINVHLVLMNDTIKYDIPIEIPIHFLEKSKPDESGIFKLIKIPLLAIKYAKLVKKIGATHSLSLLTRPNYVNTLAQKFTRHKYKSVISVRNYTSMAYVHKNAKSIMNRFLTKKLYPKADSIICNSIASRKDLIVNFSCQGNKIEVIYNPIDQKAIDDVQGIMDFFDSSYFNLIAVGRLQPVKNHELIMRSVKHIENVRLYILGEGPLKTRLEKIIVEEDLSEKVFLLGFDANPYKYLKCADLFVLGSNNEGFPNVLLEAMACGLPILSTNCKSGPDELMKLPNGKEGIMLTDFGILVPVKNQELMTKAIVQMKTDKEFLKNCKNNSLQRVLDFDKELILNEFIRVLEKS